MLDDLPVFMWGKFFLENITDRSAVFKMVHKIHSFEELWGSWSHGQNKNPLVNNKKQLLSATKM